MSIYPRDDRAPEHRDPPVPLDPQVRRQVAVNQTRTAMQWSDTAADMLVGDIVRDRENRREVGREIIALAVVAFFLLAFGLVWTVGAIRHDRLVAHETAAAQSTPAQPYAVR